LNEQKMKYFKKLGCNKARMESVLFFDIKNYAINDGPGIRTTIFFKGCPLRCNWCHNPESISPGIEKLYDRDKCIVCNGCVEVCPEKACRLISGVVVTDPVKCTSCGCCADICPAMACEMSGRVATVAELVKKIEKQRIFFDQSSGGVTFSGGEPLSHPAFLIKLLDECGRLAIHRTVDTSGFAPLSTLLDVAGRTDHFLYDIKLMDAERHKRWTGVDNGVILSNLEKLAASGASINIRLPLIKGVNDDGENIEQMARFVAGLAGEKKMVNILPYHNTGLTKYQKLGREYKLRHMVPPGDRTLARVSAVFAYFAVETMIGG